MEKARSLMKAAFPLMHNKINMMGRGTKGKADKELKDALMSFAEIVGWMCDTKEKRMLRRAAVSTQTTGNLNCTNKRSLKQKASGRKSVSTQWSNTLMDYSSVFADRQHVANKPDANAGETCKTAALAGNWAGTGASSCTTPRGETGSFSDFNPLPHTSSIINWLESESTAQTH